MPIIWGQRYRKIHVPGRTGTQDKVEDVVVGYDPDTTDRPPVPRGQPVELGPLGKKVFGFGLILVGAWLLLGDPHDWFAVFLYLIVAIGAFGLIKGLIESRHARWGMPLWRRLLPSWIIIWGIIVIVGLTVGTPHLRMVYNDHRCQYAGLNGVEITAAGGERCALVAFFPLRRSNASLNWQG